MTSMPIQSRASAKSGLPPERPAAAVGEHELGERCGACMASNAAWRASWSLYAVPAFSPAVPFYSDKSLFFCGFDFVHSDIPLALSISASA